MKKDNKLMLRSGNDTITLKPAKLFKERKYWSETTINEFERESEELTTIAEDEIRE